MRSASPISSASSVHTAEIKAAKSAFCRFTPVKSASMSLLFQKVALREMEKVSTTTLLGMPDSLRLPPSS